MGGKEPGLGDPPPSPPTHIHNQQTPLNMRLLIVQTNITSPGILGGWVSADPSNGTLAAGQSQAVVVKYDTSQNEFQGIYSADILITTNAQPLAKVTRFILLSRRHQSQYRNLSETQHNCFTAVHYCIALKDLLITI